MTQCKFEATYPASDECVLHRILDVLVRAVLPRLHGCCLAYMGAASLTCVVALLRQGVHTEQAPVRWESRALLVLETSAAAALHCSASPLPAGCVSWRRWRVWAAPRGRSSQTTT